jgi:hypothetical protein
MRMVSFATDGGMRRDTKYFAHNCGTDAVASVGRDVGDRWCWEEIDTGQAEVIKFLAADRGVSLVDECLRVALRCGYTRCALAGNGLKNCKLLVHLLDLGEMISMRAVVCRHRLDVLYA